MSEFIQLHLLTSYPPSNVNRDDLGRPKTAYMGGTERLRISSQSLKRSWRTSDIFESALSGHIGVRTKRLGFKIYEKLHSAGIKEKDAKNWAVKIAGVFGKIKKEKKEDTLFIEQLVHISPKEQEAVLLLAETLVAENREPRKDELDLLCKEKMAIDIALFGRMLADAPQYNVEASCQVAHAISTHSVVVEDDYFTAVDDLNDKSEDTGSAHIGEAGFAAALFYSYICINQRLLVDHLNGNVELANKAIKALTETATKVSPSGKQNSFASRTYANFVLAEKGEQQPRSLSVAFLKAISDQDQASAAIRALEEQVNKFDEVYGECADSRYSFNTLNGTGSLKKLLSFITD